MKRRAALLLAAIWVLLGALQAEAAETATIVKSDFSRQELLADYDFFWDALWENDPFLPVMEEAGLRLAALQREGRETVEKRCASAGDLLNVLQDQTARMGNLAHLGMLGLAVFQEYEELVEAGTFSSGSVEALWVRDPQTIHTYGLLDPGPAPVVSSAALPEAEIAYDAEQQILYFHFRTFRHALVERDRALVAQAVRAHPEARHIIFDITGNGGGSAYYWIENIVAPFGGSNQYSRTLYFKLSPLNCRYGLEEGAEALEAASAAGLPPFVEKLGLTHRIRDVMLLPGAGEAEQCSSAARRWLLIDGTVFSAADSFAAFCKESGWATVVGTPTRGDGGGIRPFLIRLPHTGLLARFSTIAAANDDGSLNAVTGTRPDFYPKPRERALDACLRLIRSSP